MTVKDLKQVYWLSKESWLLSEQLNNIENCSGEDLNKKKDRLKNIRKAQRKTEKWIYTIDDSKVRQIMILRYINALPWREIAQKIGEGKTADSYRMAASRFIARHGDNL